VNTRHNTALRVLEGCLERAEVSFMKEEPMEFVASELHGSVESIGSILGKIDSEEVLDVLFSSFCIGK